MSWPGTACSPRPRSCPLADRGIELSASQVHRLVTQAPERLSMPILVALCDIFECSPADLVQVSAETATERKAAGDNGGNVVDLATTGRPKRARIRPDA